MTQKRLTSRVTIEVMLNDETGRYMIRRTVIEAFTPTESPDDLDEKELALDDMHTTDSLDTVMTQIVDALVYLDPDFYSVR